MVERPVRFIDESDATEQEGTPSGWCMTKHPTTVQSHPSYPDKIVAFRPTFFDSLLSHYIARCEQKYCRYCGVVDRYIIAAFGSEGMSVKGSLDWSLRHPLDHVRIHYILFLPPIAGRRLIPLPLE
jgi:hypothetical protein